MLLLFLTRKKTGGCFHCKVEDMEVSMNVSLTKQHENLALSLLESRCYVKDIDIKVDGGASWLYQGYALLI